MEQARWSRATFGPDEVRGPIGALKHLAKEVKEVMEKPDDLEEYADLLFLVFDATRRAGFSFLQLEDACFDKLAKNKERVWPDWRTAPPDQPIEHKREEDGR